MNKERIMDLYLDFFRCEKGYEWGDEEILTSSNPDDFTDFLIFIRDYLADEIDLDGKDIDVTRNHYYKNSEGKLKLYRYGTGTNMEHLYLDVEGE